MEDCQVPTAVEKEAQLNEANPKKQSQAWADSTEENDECGTVGSEKPQGDLISEPATPRTVQKQIFATDTELSQDEPASVLSIWSDDVTNNSSKSTAKKAITYCTLCRVDSHPEKDCIISRFVQVDGKILCTGDSKKSKQSKNGKLVKGTFKKFRNDLDLVVMRGRRKDGLQHILELSDFDNVCALYLLLTYGDYGRAQHREFALSSNREVMDFWRHHSRKGMDKSTAEDLLRKIHDEL